MPQVIVLFHSALGLRPAVKNFADQIRLHGHRVYTPDLFDGEVFDSLEDGVRKRDSLGIPELTKRAMAYVAKLPNDVVYAGFSMGAASAEFLAATRPGSRGAILMHAGLPLNMLGVDKWPPVPVQVHYALGDPWVSPQGVESLADAVRKAGQRCDIHQYTGKSHLFADDDSSDYNATDASSMLNAVLEFLSGL